MRIAVLSGIHGNLTAFEAVVADLRQTSPDLYDGDRRASYLLLDGSLPTIRRVAYNLDRELLALSARHNPHSAWVARILLSAAPQMP